MPKILMLILITLFLSGCHWQEIDSNNIDKSVDAIMKAGTELANISANGYKYYLPNGVRMVDNTSYNEKLTANGDLYYLYIDLVSYYYQKKSPYTINDKAYFSKRLSYNGLEGYLEINKIDNSYFVEMMYNYAKIEAYVEEENISSTIMNLSYILSSIKFNDSVIKVLFDNNLLNFDEEKFSIFKPKETESNFLDYSNDYEEKPIEDNSEFIDQNIDE